MKCPYLLKHTAVSDVIISIKTCNSTMIVTILFVSILFWLVSIQEIWLIILTWLLYRYGSINCFPHKEPQCPLELCIQSYRIMQDQHLTLVFEVYLFKFRLTIWNVTEFNMIFAYCINKGNKHPILAILLTFNELTNKHLCKLCIIHFI